MTDLVKKLRQFRRTPIFQPVHDAADRIEQLERELNAAALAESDAYLRGYNVGHEAALGQPQAVPTSVLKQDEAIRQLRAAINMSKESVAWPHTSLAIREWLEKALAATEGLCPMNKPPSGPLKQA
jgi:hypothetical protein